MNERDLDRLLRRAPGVRGEPRPLAACLDAETLAAWIDGSLPATERTAAETHAADCDRCLAVLAAMAQTAPPPRVADRATWFPVRWLAPLTAAAVGITAWMIVGAPQQLPPPSAPSAVDSVKIVEADQIRKADEEQKESDRRRQASGNQADPLHDKATARAASPRSRDQVESRQAAEPGRRKDSAERQEKPAERSLAKSKEDLQARTAASAPAAPVAAPPPAQRFEAAARPFVDGPRLILSPDPNSQWRFASRSVERSTDGGRTWRLQQTGLEVDLMAASSPSASVCWAVGQAGTVLLSTDGETWRRLAFPAGSADLIGVSAQDGLTATVTAANGRRYRTADAGRTWTLQENPAAPF